jgi:hypothetical protein
MQQIKHYNLRAYLLLSRQKVGTAPQSYDFHICLSRLERMHSMNTGQTRKFVLLQPAPEGVHFHCWYTMLVRGSVLRLV